MPLAYCIITPIHTQAKSHLRYNTPLAIVYASRYCYRAHAVDAMLAVIDCRDIAVCVVWGHAACYAFSADIVAVAHIAGLHYR